jgi:hypothetical protein
MRAPTFAVLNVRFIDEASKMYSAVTRLAALVAVGIVTLMAFDASALALTGVKSRKAHATAGPFDLQIDMTRTFGGSVTVEPRAIGAGHTIIFQFDTAITVPGVASAVDAGGPFGTFSAPIAGPASNEVSVTLSGIPDNKRITVSLTGVNTTATVFSASMGFLLGDVNNSRTTTSIDVSSVKARSGSSANGSTFLYDLNATGAVSSSDISAVKAHTGLTLAAANEVSIVITKLGTGGGTVSSLPSRIICGSVCSANFTLNSSVTLTAVPDGASTFAGWSGGCAGTVPLTFTATVSLACNATFSVIPGVASLAWDPVPSTILAGYRVYYGTAPGAYSQLNGQGLNAGNATSFLVTGLTSGTKYYFAVTAYDTSNVETGFSNEVSKVAP